MECTRKNERGGEVEPLISWLGGRWAAKEAAFKALYSLDGDVKWRGDAMGGRDERGEEKRERREGRRWGWWDVEVRTGVSDGVGRAGAPYLVVYDPWDGKGGPTGSRQGRTTAEERHDGEARQGKVARVSISHDGDYVTAVVMVAI